MKDLGITKNTLRHARRYLKERGVISFFTYPGRGKATRYLILETELAPDLKGSKFDRKGSKPDPFPKHKKGQNLTPNTNKEIKPLNYGFSTKGNIEPEVEELLRKFKKNLSC